MRMRLLLIAAFATACGDNGNTSNTGSCTSSGTPQPVCIEYTKASADELTLDAEPMCADNHGTWADAPCSRASVIGGCTAQIMGPHESFTLTTWFYPGGPVVTAADVMAKCTMLGEQFVAP
jgi:hypothetical protein